MATEDQDLIEQLAVFRVGTVTSVDGRRIRVSVDKLKNGSHLMFKGGIVRNVSVGSYVKIAKGFVDLVAKVDGEYLHEDRSKPNSYTRSVDSLVRQLELSLIGYLESGAFKRGVRELPLLDNECFILTEDEARTIHDFVPDDDIPLPLGHIATDPTQEVHVGTTAIFASHLGIFGNTGSGKSYSLTKIYYELFKRFGELPSFTKNARFVLIDFNGEYIDYANSDGVNSEIITGSSLKSSYELSTRKPLGGDRLPLPRSAIFDTTFWSVILEATEKTQAPFIGRALSRWNEIGSNSIDILVEVAALLAKASSSADPTIDRNTPRYFLEEVSICLGIFLSDEFSKLIADVAECLQYHSQNNSYYWMENGTSRYANSVGWREFIEDKVISTGQSFEHFESVDQIRLKIVLQFYHETVRGYSNREHLGPLIRRMESRIPDMKKLITLADDVAEDKPLTVVSLRDVNLEMRKVIPLLLCKYLYEDKKKADNSRDRYLNLIVDEAHNILSLDSSRESLSWRDYRLETFEEIVKEGRKFGVFLTLASQRPHDISPTILSQLHNYLLHRLVNNLDILAVERAVAFLDKVSFDSLPILPTGTCVLSGVSAQVPVVVQVGQVPDSSSPNSRTINLATSWLVPQPSNLPFQRSFACEPAPNQLTEDEDEVEPEWDDVDWDYDDDGDDGAPDDF
ncbi:ATP-binding protein [Rhodococcus erythropolis]|uniref:ATP-binding protein n=1 Tax=Rhodococcus erythropolis TaxID=1833 RepID=UPI003A4D512A